LACGHKIFFLDIPKPQVQATDPTQHEGGKPILGNLQPYRPIVPLSAGARFFDAIIELHEASSKGQPEGAGWYWVVFEREPRGAGPIRFYFLIIKKRTTAIPITHHSHL